jgi:hypothetical protein
MVIPGTEITVEHCPEPGQPGAVEVAVRNAAGDLAFTHGVAELAP